MKSLVLERLIYEIALSIGNSLDLSAMLKESVPTYLRKLNCLAGAVLGYVERDEGKRLEPLYTLPKRMPKNSLLQRAIDIVLAENSTSDAKSFLGKLPLVGRLDDHMHYVMELPDFGFLLLLRSTDDLSAIDLKSLGLLNTRLANACRSCIANEQLQTEIKERQRAEGMFRDIIENALDGFYQSTLDGHYLRVNRALARILGYGTTEELLNKLHDAGSMLYKNPEDRQRFIEHLEEFGGITDFEFEFRRADGALRWMSTSARLLTDRQDGVYIEGLCQDITVRKQAERALTEAKVEAERLSQMKSDLLSMVSHELRTPLTSVLGFAKIIRKKLVAFGDRDQLTAEKISRFLERLEVNTEVIVTEGERLTELVNNVLDLAKLEAGQFDWSIRSVSIHEVLEYSVNATKFLFQDDSIRLVNDVPEDFPCVMCDRDRLIQVVINLISNAAKFTTQGEVRLSASAEDDQITMRVADSGIGVPEAERASIFHAFHQVGDTLTDKPKGTGLGLPICKEIIEHLGGRIWVESTPGGGSTFAFTVPFDAVCEQPQQ